MDKILSLTTKINNVPTVMHQGWLIFRIQTASALVNLDNEYNGNGELSWAQLPHSTKLTFGGSFNKDIRIGVETSPSTHATILVNCHSNDISFELPKHAQIDKNFMDKLDR